MLRLPLISPSPFPPLPFSLFFINPGKYVQLCLIFVTFPKKTLIAFLENIFLARDMDRDVKIKSQRK